MQKVCVAHEAATQEEARDAHGQVARTCTGRKGEPVVGGECIFRTDRNELSPELLFTAASPTGVAPLCHDSLRLAVVTWRERTHRRAGGGFKTGWRGGRGEGGERGRRGTPGHPRPPWPPTPGQAQCAAGGARRVRRPRGGRAPLFPPPVRGAGGLVTVRPGHARGGRASTRWPPRAAAAATRPRPRPRGGRLWRRRRGTERPRQEKKKKRRAKPTALPLSLHDQTKQRLQQNGGPTAPFHPPRQTPRWGVGRQRARGMARRPGHLGAPDARPTCGAARLAARAPPLAVLCRRVVGLTLEAVPTLVTL